MIVRAFAIYQGHAHEKTARPVGLGRRRREQRFVRRRVK